MNVRQVKIGDVCSETSQRNPGNQPAKTFRYVDISTIDRETKQILDPPTILGADAPSRARKQIQVSDVLVSTVRPALNAVAMVPDWLNAEIASTGFCVLRPNPDLVNPRFLYYRARTPAFVQYLCDRATGASYPAVTDAIVKKAPIALPPLPEQKRIIAILDKAEEAQRLREQADRRTADLIPALFHEMFGDPAINPKGWKLTSLRDICDLVNGRAFKPFEWGTVGKPIIRIQNLNDPLKSFNFFEGDLPEKYCVTPGDILLSWSGTPGTSFGCFRWNGPEGWLNQHIFNVRIKPQMDGEFFIHHINSKLTELIAKAHGGVGLQHVTKGMLDSTILMAPPISLQRNFAARVAAIRAMEGSQAASHRRIDDLFRSLLHRAFACKL